MRRTILSGLIAAALLGVLLSLPVLAQITNFDSIVASGDITATDDVTAGDDLSVGGWINGNAATSLTITAGGTITPTGTYQRITAAAARGTSSVTGHAAGRILVLVNVGSNTITLTDTGTLKLSGNAALGQYDTITLQSDGTNWIELAKANN
jgi:hypothetical protein